MVFWESKMKIVYQCMHKMTTLARRKKGVKEGVIIEIKEEVTIEVKSRKLNGVKLC